MNIQIGCVHVWLQQVSLLVALPYQALSPKNTLGQFRPGFCGTEKKFNQGHLIPRCYYLCSVCLTGGYLCTEFTGFEVSASNHQISRLFGIKI